MSGVDVDGLIYRVAAQHRQAIIALERTAAVEMVRAYGAIWQALRERVEALAGQYNAAAAANAAIAPSWVLEYGRLDSLERQFRQEMARFIALAEQKIIEGQRIAVTWGETYAETTVRLQARAYGINIAWDRLPREYIEQMVGFTANGSPLRALLDSLGPQASRALQDGLLSGLALGRNPRDVARLVRAEMGGNLARALRISRTEMMRASREATRATWEANPDTVGGWKWMAAHQGRTCFPRGTLITTRRGAIPIEQVAVGDEALTHTGHYRRVSETMSRAYSGEMVTLVAGKHRVTCTEDHPLLVERQGKLDWIEAGKVCLGDNVFCQIQGGAEIINHALRHIAIESGIGQSHNGMSTRLKPQSFSGIAVADCFLPVPVSAVNFENRVNARQVKVNGVAPSVEGVFLQEPDSYGFKANARIPFRLCLASMGAIAPYRTKCLVIGRDSAESFAAGGADFHNGRTPAFFRAVFAILFGNSEYAPTTRAGAVFGVRRSALCRAVRSLASGAFRNDKGLSALGTYFCDGMCYMVTCFRAKFPGARRGAKELFATDRAFSLNSWLCRALIAVAVGVFALIEAITGRRAELATAAPHVAGGDCKWLAALNTRYIHSSSITQVATHCQAVYNLEVEQDHSYIANGFAVHNCPMCLAMDGTEHSVSERLDDHPNGRCRAVPIVKGLPAVQWQTGEAWLKRQPESVQRQVLGTGYDAWHDGKVQLSDFIGQRTSREWGSTRYAKSIGAILA